MRRIDARRAVPLVVIIIGGAWLSCARLGTPEEACSSFLRGVQEGDAGAVHDALLQSTQVSLYTVARLHREMTGIIEHSYPKGERAQALLRLRGGRASDGKELFRTLYPQSYAADFHSRIGKGPQAVELVPPGDAAMCRRGEPGGAPFQLARAPSGRWGMAELDKEWEMAKLRAFHDLDTVRENARLYRSSRSTR